MLNPESSPDQGQIPNFWTDKNMSEGGDTREYYTQDSGADKKDGDQPEQTEKGSGKE